VNPFEQTFGNRLVDLLAPRVLTPAFAFWAGGLIAFWAGGHGRAWPGRLAALSATLQITLLIAAVALIAGSALVAEHLTRPTLRTLEGYWPMPLARPWQQRAVRRRATAEQRAQELARKAFHGDLSAEDVRQMALIEQRLHDLPTETASTMPTRVGNILRAAEDRPRSRYGLDPVVCWPHLWLSLDNDTQQALDQARKELDDATRLWLWSLFFVAWTGWAWWAPLVTVTGCTAAYYSTLVPAGRSYGLLMQAAFDLYRRRVYHALDWPSPADAASEPAAGEQVTTYLWRGIAPPGMRFTLSSGEKPDSD